MWILRCSRWILPLLLSASLFAQEYSLSTYRVELQMLPVQRYFDGTVEAVHRATVSAQLAGRIEAVLFDVDDLVEAGDVLVRFRSPEQRAGVERAEASLNEAMARAAEAEAEHRRIKEVFARKLVSQSAMDKAAAELKSAQARVNAARAALDQAREALEHTLVRAPYSGIVTERHAEAGETVTVGQPLMSGISLDRLRVTTSVPQRYLDALHADPQATVYLPDPDRAPVTSDRVTVFPAAEPSSHSFPVRVELPEGLGGVYPGIFVKVAFSVAESRQLWIPRQAVVARSELTGVYVVAADGAIQFRQLRLGDARDQQVQVLAGLTAGDTIALDPVAATIALKKRRNQAH